MSDQADRRVRVTAPRGGPRLQRVADPRADAGSRLEDSATIEEIYVRSLVRAQLRLALRTLGLVALLAAAAPLLFFLTPSLADETLLGLPLAWAALGVLAYPVLLLAGWRYLRGAERNERDFAELVRRGPR